MFSSLGNDNIAEFGYPFVCPLVFFILKVTKHLAFKYFERTWYGSF